MVRTTTVLALNTAHLSARDAFHRSSLQLSSADFFDGARLRLDIYAAHVLPFYRQRVGIEHSVSRIFVP